MAKKKFQFINYKRLDTTGSGVSSPRKKVYQFDENDKLIKEFISVPACCESMGLDDAKLRTAIKKGRPIDGKKYSWISFISGF